MYTGHVSTTSNREDWMETIVLTDEETGDLIDISACSIKMTLARMTRQPNQVRMGYYDYASNYGYGGGPILTGSTDTGEITLPDIGTFQWLFPASRMAGVPGGEYAIGIKIEQDVRTVQLIIGTVDVAEGIDTQ